METNKLRQPFNAIMAVFFGFFIMGFVDMVGIATNYVKKDFGLSASVSGLLPMMVFLWFAIFSIPTGMIMGKIGRKKTVLIALVLTGIGMLIPYFLYQFVAILLAFVLLGISNTILQVALNPLVAAMFSQEKTASLLSVGQFIKAISSLLGPIIVGFTAEYFGNWKITFLLFSVTSLLSVLFLAPAKVREIGFESTPATFSGAFDLLTDRFILACFLVIFLLVGYDVCMNVSIPELLMKQAGMTLQDAGYGTSIYFAARTLGSFLGAYFLLKIKPGQFLLISLILAILAFLILLFTQNKWLMSAMIFLSGLAISNIFSIIFAFALQKIAHRSNEISALLIMGVVGGALIPPVQGFVSDYFGFGNSLTVILLCLLLMLFLSLNLKKHVQ